MTGYPTFILKKKKKSSLHPLYKAISLSTAIGISTALVGCGSDKTDSEYLQSAIEYQKAKDSQSAIIELKNALQKNPKNTDARSLLAKLYLSKQMGIEAEKEINKALETGADKASLILPLAQALHFQLRYKDLLDQTLIIDNIPPNDQAEIFLLRGISNIGLRQNSDAEVDFKMGIEVSPNSIASKLSQAFLLALGDKNVEAVKAVNKILIDSPNYSEAYLLKARLFASGETKDFEKAVAMFDKVITLQPNRMQLYLYKAQLQLQLGKAEQADQTINAILKLHPNHIPSLLIKSASRLALQDFESADTYVNKVLTLDDMNQTAKLYAGMVAFRLEQYEQARKHLKSVVSVLPETHMAKRMLAYSEFKLGYIDQANETLAAIEKLAPSDSKIFSQVSSELSVQGDFKNAVEWLEKALVITPDDQSLRAQLGYTKLKANDESGIKDLEQAINASTAEAKVSRTLLAQYYVKKGQSEKALEIAKGAIEYGKEDPEAYTLYGMTLLSTGHFDESSEQFAQALKYSPSFIPALMGQVKLSVINKNYDNAYSQLKKVITFDSDHEQALTQLFGISRKTGQQKDALDTIINSSKKNPENHNVKIIEALAYLALDQDTSAQAVLDSIPVGSNNYGKAQALIGHSYYQKKQFDQAVKAYTNWAKAEPNTIKAHEYLVKALQANGDSNTALTRLQEAITLNPESSSLKTYEINLLFKNERPNQAIKRSRSLLQENPNIAIVHLLEGQYYLNGKLYPEAIKQFEQLHQKKPSTRSVIWLATALNKNQQKDKSTPLLENWLMQHPDDDAIRMFLANQNISKDNSGAIAQYRELLSKNPGNLVVRNNLAWALGQSGDLSEALKHAKYAFDQRPNIPQIADTYGFLLYQTGDSVAAENILEKAHQKLPEENSIAYHYALSLNKNGQSSKALTILRSLKDKSFPEKKEANSLIDQLTKQ